MERIPHRAAAVVIGALALTATLAGPAFAQRPVVLSGEQSTIDVGTGDVAVHAVLEPGHRVTLSMRGDAHGDVRIGLLAPTSDDARAVSQLSFSVDGRDVAVPVGDEGIVVADAATRREYHRAGTIVATSRAPRGQVDVTVVAPSAHRATRLAIVTGAVDELHLDGIEHSPRTRLLLDAWAGPRATTVSDAAGDAEPPSMAGPILIVIGGIALIAWWIVSGRIRSRMPRGDRDPVA